MNTLQKQLLGLGVVALGVGIYMSRKALSGLASSALDAANAAIFTYSLPASAQPYADVIRAAADATGVDPFLIAAIGDRESRWGQALSAEGTGDNGHGRGIMQIDDRTWASWIAANDWRDPYTNVVKGATIYASNESYFANKGLTGDALVQAALAAYNHGPGNVWANIQAGQSIDAGTANGNYGSDVLARASSYSDTYQSQVA